MSAEQKARDMLERMGVEDAQNFSAGDLVELANLIAEVERLRGGPLVHVLPVFDGERKHIESPDCWCMPHRDTEDARVIIHHRKAEA